MRWDVAAQIRGVNKHVIRCEVRCVCSLERLFKQGKVNKNTVKMYFFLWSIFIRTVFFS